MEEKFTQKWCIVSLLEDIDEDHSFHRGEWPLHITVAGVHDVAWNENLVSEFKKFMENMNAFTVNTTQRGMLGTTEVIFVDKNRALLHLHSLIIEFLESKGAIFNNSEWQKDGYIPHYTIQKNGRITENEKLTINNIALVDMFPDQDGNQRKITKIFNLKST